MKAEIYNAVAGFNRSFDVAVESLHILRDEGVVSAGYVQQQIETMEELRAGVNNAILSILNPRELADRERYSKLRLTTEARLKT